jgi:hypothetical protein
MPSLALPVVWLPSSLPPAPAHPTISLRVANHGRASSPDQAFIIGQPASRRQAQVRGPSKSLPTCIFMSEAFSLGLMLGYRP